MKALPKPLTALVLLAGMGLASTAEAALISRLGGLAVYDTDRNITWLANANANGLMNWTAANTWATGLNVGGYTGWRLPTTDPACGANYNCINSELGNLYYTEGGLSQGSSITSSAVLSNLFTNMQNSVYWSGTEYAPIPFTRGPSIPTMATRAATIRTLATVRGPCALAMSPPCQSRA